MGITEASIARCDSCGSSITITRPENYDSYWFAHVEARKRGWVTIEYHNQEKPGENSLWLCPKCVTKKRLFLKETP